MDDAFRMGRGQTLGHLDHNRKRILHTQGSVCDALGQGLARVIRHGHIHLAAGRFTDVIDDADIGMIEPRGRACLGDEPLADILIDLQMMW